MTKTFMLVGASAIAAVSLLFGTFLVLGAMPELTHATASGFIENSACRLNDTASSSPVYMTAGTATSTINCVIGTSLAADSAVLLVRLNASSSPNTVLNIFSECSQDGIDWYQGCLLTDSATTSPAISSQVVPLYSWRFASSTAGLGAVASNNNSDTRIFKLQTPTKFLRAIFVLPAGSANAAVWGQIIGKKQI